MEENITITKREYLELKFSELKLDMLEACGVDNWCGYSDALHPEEGKDIRELKEDLEKEILG